MSAFNIHPNYSVLTVISFSTKDFNPFMYTTAVCNNLPAISNGEVSYTPPRSVSASLPVGTRYRGTVATYSCSSGYQLVGGSSLRACGANGEWNGTAPSCGKYTVSGLMYNYRYNLCIIMLKYI